MDVPLALSASELLTSHGLPGLLAVAVAAASGGGEGGRSSSSSSGGGGGGRGGGVGTTNSSSAVVAAAAALLERSPLAAYTAVSPAMAGLAGDWGAAAALLHNNHCSISSPATPPSAIANAHSFSPPTSSSVVTLNGGAQSATINNRVKEEPLSNSSGISDEQTTADYPQREVPACSICGSDSTGIHFGVEACAACSAFFRRTVVLRKNYVCQKDDQCVVLKDAENSTKCRACRFKKCLAVGMDRRAVQHRRDAIGKHSSLSRRESEVNGDVPCASVPSCSFDTADSTTTPSKQPRFDVLGVLQEVLQKYEGLTNMRKLFYTTDSLRNIFDTSTALEPIELTNFGECMFQLWRIEPRLVAEFVCSNKFLAQLDPDEKMKIFKNFLVVFQALEEPYLTWRHGGLEKQWWMMPNRTYFDFTRADVYFESLALKDLNLDKKTAISIFLPSFQQALNLIGRQLEVLDVSVMEMIGLVGLLLFDPNVAALLNDTRLLLGRLRDHLVRELLMHLEKHGVHAQRTRENMQLMSVFDLVPRDGLFDEIFDLRPVVSQQ